MAVLLAVTGAAGAMVPAASDCGADCCRPTSHTDTHVRPSQPSQMRAMGCCAGVMDVACDWHTPAESDDAAGVSAIHSVPHPGGPLPSAGSGLRAVMAGHPSNDDIDSGPIRSAPVSIYLQTRSLLI